jgi:hypothetical protein
MNIDNLLLNANGEIDKVFGTKLYELLCDKRDEMQSEYQNCDQTEKKGEFLKKYITFLSIVMTKLGNNVGYDFINAKYR